MVKSETLRKYELVVIVDARLSADEKESVLKEAAEVVNKNGGKVINSQIWLEKHKFSFKMKKSNEGTYYLINFEGEGDVSEKVRAALRMNEKLLRFAVVNVE